LFGVGIDAAAALSCYEAGDDYGAIFYPGFDGLDLGEREKEEPYIFHFPDGNASIARLLVRSLISAAIPGHDMYDVVTARADYNQLDRASSPVRIRLNSTVVKVKHDGPPASAKQVNVLYMRDGRLQGVRAGHVVMACSIKGNVKGNTSPSTGRGGDFLDFQPLCAGRHVLPWDGPHLFAFWHGYL
jgi:spermidine dehydrogenase